jgi:hypothetical protein
MDLESTNLLSYVEAGKKTFAIESELLISEWSIDAQESLAPRHLLNNSQKQEEGKRIASRLGKAHRVGKAEKEAKKEFSSVLKSRK